MAKVSDKYAGKMTKGTVTDLGDGQIFKGDSLGVERYEVGDEVELPADVAKELSLRGWLFTGNTKAQAKLEKEVEALRAENDRLKGTVEAVADVVDGETEAK